MVDHMAFDDRDYVKDRIRKRDRYVERASFRISEGERLRLERRRVWMRWLFALLALLLLLVLAPYLRYLIGGV